MTQARSTAGWDLHETLRSLPLVMFLAWSDLRARYRRSALGPWWLTLGTAAGTAGLGLIWSDLLRLDRAVFVPALTAGLIVWQLLSACITDGTTTYWRQSALLRNVRLPLLVYPLQMVAKHAINLLHVLPVFVVVAVVFQVPVTAYTALVLPCLLLVLANLLWLTVLLSMLGARFRDLEYLLAAAMPILMFLSPVFYRPSYLPVWGDVIWLNPLSHLIEIVRAPLLGTAPPARAVWTNLALLVVGVAITTAAYRAKRDRIPYWV